MVAIYIPVVVELNVFSVLLQSVLQLTAHIPYKISKYGGGDKKIKNEIKINK